MKNWLLSLCLLLSACSPDPLLMMTLGMFNHSDPKKEEHKPAPAAPKKGQEEESYVGWRYVEVPEVMQRVKRYNCLGQLESDKWERVRAERVLTKINPRQNIAVDRGTFTNIKNNSTDSNQAFDPKGFWVGLDRNLFGNVVVEKGDTTIKYKYERCTARNEKRECMGWEVTEEGSVDFTVEVKSQSLNEVCERRRSCILGTFEPCQ